MTGARRAAAAATPWLIAAVLVGLGSIPTRAVSPKDAATAESEFAAGRAMADVAAIARRPHPLGSAALAAVRRHIVERVEALGLGVEQQIGTAPDAYGGGGTAEIVNVIAWIPGGANTKAVVLMAHYDSTPATPGGNDNAAAVAALLETARALQAGPRLRNDVILLFTDAEEPYGRRGANTFMAIPGMPERLGLVVNFEANGGSGASQLVETNGPQLWLVDELAGAASPPAATSVMTQLSSLFGEIGTDFDVVKAAGIPGLHFAYLRGSPIYHTMADDITAVSEASLQHHGEHALAIARHFGNLDLGLPGRADDAVFFTIGSTLVRYQASWAVPPALVAAAGLAWAIRRRHADSVGGLWRAALWVLLGVGLGAAAGTAAWMVVTAAHSTPGVATGYVYGGFVAAASVAVSLVVAARCRAGASAVATGQAALWVLLALATALWLPGFSYLFTWPALAAVAALLLPGEPGGWVRFILVAVPTVLLLTPAVDVLFLLAQPRPGNPDSELIAAVFAPLALATLAVLLLVAVTPGRTAPASVEGAGG